MIWRGAAVGPGIQVPVVLLGLGSVGRALLQADDVLLLQLQFSGVFDSDNAFPDGDEGGRYVEQCGFSGASTTGDNEVHARFDAGFHERRQGWRE